MANRITTYYATNTVGRVLGTILGVVVIFLLLRWAYYKMNPVTAVVAPVNGNGSASPATRMLAVSRTPNGMNGNGGNTGTSTTTGDIANARTAYAAGQVIDLGTTARNLTQSEATAECQRRLGSDAVATSNGTGGWKCSIPTPAVTTGRTVTSTETVVS